MIFVSGYGSVTTRRGLREDGVAFLQKPFAVDDLVGKVREVLDRG